MEEAKCVVDLILLVVFRLDSTQLTRSDTKEEIAVCLQMLSVEGPFAGERTEVLRIQPCTIDIDYIVLTYVLLEMKRWEREEADLVDEEPAGYGADAAAEAGDDTGANVMTGEM